MKLCQETSEVPLPVTEKGLCAFSSRLADQGLKYKTIKVYLSAVRHLQIEANYPDTFGGKHSPKLKYVLRGIKKHEAERGRVQRTRLPITPEILRKLRAGWEPSYHLGDTKMLWAACYLCFFAFLRIGEAVSPGEGQFDPNTHLGVDDIAVDDSNHPTALEVHLKQSKTDPFRKGVRLFVGRTGTELCPVAAMLTYLVARGTKPGPLFQFEDGRHLTRARFVDALRRELRAAGLEEKDYSSHSFRIGAASTAAANGVEDAIIKTLGHWESVAYLQYVQIPKERLVGYSNILAA